MVGKLEKWHKRARKWLIMVGNGIEQLGIYRKQVGKGSEWYKTERKW